MCPILNQRTQVEETEVMHTINIPIQRTRRMGGYAVISSLFQFLNFTEQIKQGTSTQQADNVPLLGSNSAP